MSARIDRRLRVLYLASTSRATDRVPSDRPARSASAGGCPSARSFPEETIASNSNRCSATKSFPAETISNSDRSPRARSFPEETIAKGRPPPLRQRVVSRRQGLGGWSRALGLLVTLFALFALGCSKGGSGGGDTSGNGAPKGAPLRVAAASDLALAFKEVGTAFEKQSGKHVEFSFGSTGLLAKQISEGAPFDVFAAANVSFVDDVVRDGACLGDTKALYARGRIVMWSKDPWSLPKDITDLKDAKYTKVALANPEHAPYGRAARDAMAKAGVWATVQPRVVYGENVQQTLMFARSGNADVAVVALSLAVTSPGNYVPIDPSLHEPLDQALVVCKGGSKGAKTNEARSFIEFVGSEAGRAIMRRFGFLLPGETVAR